MNRIKAQPLPQFHSDEGLSSLNESSTLTDVVQALVTLTVALAITNAKVDSLTQHGVPQVATAAIHPGPTCFSAMENHDTETPQLPPQLLSQTRN